MQTGWLEKFSIASAYVPVHYRGLMAVWKIRKSEFVEDGESATGIKQEISYSALPCCRDQDGMVGVVNRHYPNIGGQSARKIRQARRGRKGEQQSDANDIVTQRYDSVMDSVEYRRTPVHRCDVSGPSIVHVGIAFKKGFFAVNHDFIQIRVISSSHNH